MSENIENNEKKKRFRRTKSSLEKDVNYAITSLIEEVGFANVTLTAIAQRAQIEPAVFYRRYANLEELFDQFTKKYDYWLSNLAETIPTDLSHEDMFKWIMRNLINALYKNKVMQQLLIWELSHDNNTTRRTTDLRESTNLPLIQRLEYLFKDTNLDINAITSVLIAGIYYLILYQGRSNFCGINFGKRTGKKRLEIASDQLTELLFAQINRAQEKALIADRLRAEGISEEIIAKCIL